MMIIDWDLWVRGGMLLIAVGSILFSAFMVCMVLWFCRPGPLDSGSKDMPD